jgi:hypothetical protein
MAAAQLGACGDLAITAAVGSMSRARQRKLIRVPTVIGRFSYESTNFSAVPLRGKIAVNSRAR